MTSFKVCITVLLLLPIVSACKSDKKNAPDNGTISMEEPVFDPESGIVNVVTEAMDFQSPDTLNSGWNTFIYTNNSAETHFIQLDKYPEGITIENTKRELLPPFDEGMELIMQGKNEAAMEAFGKIPEWFQQVVLDGGTGMISPGHTATSTFYLKPGYYLMECYVKMENGQWHTSHGMLKEIVVTENTTTLIPEGPTVRLTISSTEGIEVTDEISAGRQVFEVTFKDQTIYEHFLGHDVNLVQYNQTASIDSLVQWMNWMEPTGLKTPAPEGFTFIGGINNMPEGSVGYFEAALGPGEYLFISEVPSADEKKLLYTFTVQ